MEESGSAFRPEGSGTPRRGRFSNRRGSIAAVARRSAYAPVDPLEEVIDERLDEGLRAIEEHAIDLMREIAAEMWRASGADVASEQQRILHLLSRDQSIRSLIASSDDRFQAIAMRTARLEESLAELAESGRAIRDAVRNSAESMHEIATSPTLQGVDLMRSELEQVERHIATAFAHMDERDRTLTEGIKALIDEGTAVLTAHDDAIAERVRATVADEVGSFGDRIDMLYERGGIQRRSLEETRLALERLVEARTMGLAQLIRSDSQALGGLIEETAAARHQELKEAIEERLSAFASANNEQIELLARTSEEQVSALTLAMSASMERHAARIAEEIDTKLGAVGATIAEAVVDSRGRTEERMAGHVDDRMTALAKLVRSDNRVLAERLSNAQPTSPIDAETLRQTLRSVKELQAGLGADVAGTLDRRLQSISEQLHKETQSTAESMVKVAEVLGQKLDKLSVRVDQGYGGDLQIVLDRMSDAIRAMAGPTRRDQGRFDED